MDATTKNLVRQRAGDCCEYCHLPQDATPFITFHIEHVIAKQHTPDDDNLDDLKRLALACDRCNLFKGPNLSSIDPNSGEIVNLFNPRTDNWNDHFATRDAKIVGLTPMGRATARLLNMNDSRRVDLREQWLDEGGQI
ncbi:MAG: HNH endonuclease [Pirellula sp.]|nr:HNH endonuclease [Pirellula sp.]